MNPRAFVGVVGLLVLASCFNGARTPVATLAPRSADALPRTHGPFSVVYAAPKGKVVDRKQSAGVTVLFSRALRSVDTADDEHVPNVSIKTKTGSFVRGTWRFTGTRGLLFRPEGELPGGSDFVVTVPGDTRALDGSTLGNPYTFELETPGPSLAAFHVVGPAGTTEKSMPAEAAFRLTFDQAVEPAAVALATTIRVFKGDGDRGESVKVFASRDPAASSEDRVVLLRPEKALAADRQVELTIASTLRGTGGARPMAAPYTRVMRTHGPLRFVDFSCPRIETKGRCKANGDVKVVLSNPVAPQELKNHVKLAKLPPRTPGKNEKKRVDPSTDHWLGVAPKLGEQYKVVLTAGMKDIFGQTLDKDATFEIDVEAPLVKPANVPAPAPVASAKPALHHPAPQPLAPSDPRPRREHLPYRLELGLAGQVLEAKSAHKVAASAINIPTYSEVATALSDDQAASWLLARGSTTDFLGRNGIASTWIDAHGRENERAVSFVDLDGVLAQRKGRGPALVVLNPPGTAPDGYGRTESFVTVTDLGVTAKMSPYGSLVWVTSLASGKPIANATVALRVGPKNGHLGGETWHGTTDADGVALVPLDAFDPIAKEGSGEGIRDDAAIVVRSGDDWTITKVVRSAVESRLTSGFASMSKSGKWAGTIFADRGVFRPGETAKVAGIVRVVETSGLRAIPGRELRVELKDRNGEQIFDGRATCDEFGTFALDVPIPKTAELGQATIVASARAGGKSNTTESGVFHHDVRILAYKANEFKVSADTDKPAYVRGDDATLTVHGDYLYGAPMAGAAVTSSVTRQEVPFTPPLTEGFVTSDEIFTGDVPETTEEAQAIQSQDGSLDGEGRFTRKVDLKFDDQKRPERISFDATVTDLSRRDVSARATAILHPAEFYVAIKQPADRFVASGTAFKPEIAAVDPKGIRRGGVNVKVELVERKWNAVVGEQPDGRATKSTKPQDVVLSSCDAQTNAKTASCDLRVPHAGYFVVRATASDPRGNTVRSSTAIYGTEDAVANTTTATAWAADDRHGVKLEPNKKTYEVGDTAKIVLRSPFKEGEALVTVERNGVLWRQVVPIKGPLPVVQVPVKPELYPNAYVSVVAVRGRIADPPANGGVDLGAPDYRFGWAKLEVNQEAHRLKVNVAAAHPEYQPGSMVDTDVVVTDRAGKPVSTSLTFYVVDEGVLALTSYVTPDPLPAFVEPRGLSVFTFDNRELLAHLIPMKAGERVPSLGWEYAISKTPTTYDKGDDGGDGPAAMKRADFRTTAYFETGKRTDANGKARFTFKLPDNLTTFRMMAVAAAADDRFGSGDSQVTTFRRLMARPALPRLVRTGDQLEASVVVSSKADPNGSPNMNVDVKMEAKGLTLGGPATRTITMARGGQAEVRFPVKALVPGDAVVSFEVRSGADVDKVEITRHVEIPVSVESTAVYGEANGDTAVALGDLKDIRHDQGGLTVRVTPSALVGLAATIEHLEDYPYGCTEQLTSRLVPLVALGDLTKDSGAKLPKDVDQTIDGIVETMLKRQDYDGGFGFWDKGSAEPWLTAYALMGIHGAVDRKRFVPKDVLERGKDYLSSTLVASLRKFTPTPKDDEDPKEDADAGPESVEARQKLEDQKAIDYGTAALLADTLVDLGWTGPGTLNILYDARAGKRLFAQAALLHAMAKSEMSGKQVDMLRREVESRLRVGPQEVDVDESESETFAVLLDSHARTLAMVLRALLAVDPHHPLAPRMARKLLALRQDTGAWRNTQEDAWSLMALADYRRLQESSASDHTVRVMLGGSEFLKTEFPRGSMREDKVVVAPDVLASKGGPLAFEVSGDGPIHFAAELKYATAALPTRPRDEGLFVQKYVRGVPASEVQKVLATIPKKTADSVGAGELVIVDLLFESAEPREQVVVDDPLPAGLEALDYGIDTTSQATRDAEGKRDDTKTTWLGTTFRAAESRREVKDDRVLTFYKHIEPGMYRVQYLARATSIGTFVVPPTRIEAMYSPEVYGRTPATTLVVRSK